MSFGIIHDTFYDEHVNPYYEKWKPGRPSKAAKEKRAKSDEWIRQYIKDHPEEYPLTTFLISKAGTATLTDGKIEIVPGERKVRQVKVNWMSRNIVG